MCCRSGFFICLGRRRAQCVVVADHDVIQVARKPAPADFCMRDVGGFGQWIVTRYEIANVAEARLTTLPPSVVDSRASRQHTGLDFLDRRHRELLVLPRPRSCHARAAHARVPLGADRSLKFTGAVIMLSLILRHGERTTDEPLVLGVAEAARWQSARVESDGMAAVRHLATWTNYSITSSASASKVAGTLMLSAFAAL
jgi:hypothetical protein